MSQLQCGLPDGFSWQPTPATGSLSHREGGQPSSELLLGALGTFSMLPHLPIADVLRGHSPQTLLQIIAWESTLYLGQMV